MSLFQDMFTTRTLAQLACVLGVFLAAKAVGAYFGFSWAAAFAQY